MPDPRYTSNNIKRAFQLNWHLSLFPRDDVVGKMPQLVESLDALREATEKDGVRILRTKTGQKNTQLFFLSSKPNVMPSQIVRSVKGRLQYVIRDAVPKAFQRNFHLASVGSASADTVRQYVRRQTEHHQMADPKVQKRFEEVGRFEDASIDLVAEQTNAYGRFCLAYHFAFTRTQRWSEIDVGAIEAWKKVALRSVEKHGGHVGECSVLADHMHVLVQAPMSISPELLALSIMNNLTFIEARECLQSGYYVGTIGLYGRGAVK